MWCVELRVHARAVVELTGGYPRGGTTGDGCMSARMHAELANFIWSFRDVLRGAYKRGYHMVVVPATSTASPQN